MKSSSDSVREHLARALAWEQAHVGFERVVADLAPELRGARPAGYDHSPWQLLEHVRLAQHDLLAFCRDADYAHVLTWPDDYWPTDPAPPEPAAWDASIAGYRADRAALQTLVADEAIALESPVPTGSPEQSYLRAILLVIDHNAYHLGQLVAVRRALGAWG